jgi:hypothetical protein
MIQGNEVTGGMDGKAQENVLECIVTCTLSPSTGMPSDFLSALNVGIIEHFSPEINSVWPVSP